MRTSIHKLLTLVFLLMTYNASSQIYSDQPYFEVATQMIPDFNCDCYSTVKVIHQWFGDDGSRASISQTINYSDTYLAPNSVITPTDNPTGTWVVKNIYRVYHRKPGRNSVVYFDSRTFVFDIE